jgi:flagellar basal-body rod modification protein FlgD
MSAGTTAAGTNASALKAASSLASTAAATTNGSAKTSTETSKVAQDRKTIAQNFDAFLSLLTTQLKNQNPLDPLDANQFTQQLVQFSGVEQQLKANDLLTTISKAIGSNGGSSKMNAGSAASLIGMQVSVDGGTQTLTKDANGGLSAQFPVQVQSNYKNYQVEIRNSTGQTVYQGGWSPSGNGEQTFNWNGVRSDGAATDPADKYTISVVGELADGNKSLMSTMRSGIVTSVNLSGVEETVQFGGLSFPISQIKQIAKAPTASSTTLASTAASAAQAAAAAAASKATGTTGTTGATGTASATDPSADL